MSGMGPNATRANHSSMRRKIVARALLATTGIRTVVCFVRFSTIAPIMPTLYLDTKVTVPVHAATSGTALHAKRAIGITVRITTARFAAVVISTSRTVHWPAPSPRTAVTAQRR